LPGVVTKTTPSIPWFTAIQGIKGKHDLGNLAPEGCFISAETIEREVGQISKTQEAACERNSSAFAASDGTRATRQLELAVGQRPQGYCVPSGRMRTRPGSMTVKCPTQSVRSLILAARIVPISAAVGIGSRNSTMPDDAGNPARQASSPKILVEGESDSLVAHCQFQYVLILAFWRHGANPNYVMPSCLELVHGVAGNIFISEKAHFTLRSDILFPISTRRAHTRDKPQGRRGRGLDEPSG
jgi:hypothetical protein